MHELTATYSPEDNKLRLYTATRLDAATYERVRAAGFRWAPKQELFVAPAWSPERDDLLTELAGTIDDEDTSLVDRAEERAERFEEYSRHRAVDAHAAHDAVSRIADGIPLGQPILVGHHSERHARKDAERIESGMRRAVKMWETSQYWTARARGAVAAAKYKERPDVRARRIKGLESDLRKQERTRKSAGRAHKLWSILHDPESLKRKDGQPTTFRERALFVANVDRCSYGLWSDLNADKVTPEDAQTQRLAECARVIASAERWTSHLNNRLAYERAMLAESGYTPPAKPKTKGDLPLLNYGGTVSYRNQYSHDEAVTMEAVGMTKAEWAAINKDYKGSRVSACGTHRVRTAIVGRGPTRGLCIVYLTDSKQHERPSPAVVEEKATEEHAERVEKAVAAAARRVERRTSAPAPTVFDGMRESLRAGVKTVSAPQLFPTPPDVARRMVEAAGVQVYHHVLEPSAGIGSIWRELSGKRTAVEINQALAGRLREMCTQQDSVVCADFLACTPDGLGTFDRVVMNPPFQKGEDIKHILHARRFLKPGGVLVALCANGPRQVEKLYPLAEEWEELPEGTFKEQGTGVRVAMLTLRAGDASTDDGLNHPDHGIATMPGEDMRTEGVTNDERNGI